MKNFEIYNFEETKRRVHEAEKSALTREQLEELKDQQDRIAASLVKGEISNDEFAAKMEEFNSRLGNVNFENIAEFKYALSLILDNDIEIKDILAHENEHMTQAQSLGLEAKYSMQFMNIGEEGKISFYPSVSVEFPKDMPAEEKAEKLKLIIGAAENLSSRDKSQLGIE